MSPDKGDNTKQEFIERIKSAGLKVKRDSRKYIGGSTMEMDFVDKSGQEFTYYYDSGMLGLYGTRSDKDEELFLVNGKFINVFNLIGSAEIPKVLPVTDDFKGVDTFDEDLACDVENGYMPDMSDDEAINSLI